MSMMQQSKNINLYQWFLYAKEVNEAVKCWSYGNCANTGRGVTINTSPLPISINCFGCFNCRTLHGTKCCLIIVIYNHAPQNTMIFEDEATIIRIIIYHHSTSFVIYSCWLKQETKRGTYGSSESWIRTPDVTIVTSNTKHKGSWCHFWWGSYLILEENDCRYGHQKESYKQKFLTNNSVHFDDKLWWWWWRWWWWW